MLGCVPPSFMLLLMCFMPETPRFLLTQHRHQEAMAAVQFLWGSEQGWEEPPAGAGHQVTGRAPELREVTVRYGPFTPRRGRHTLSVSRSGTGPGSVLSCRSFTAQLGPRLRAHWESLTATVGSHKEKGWVGQREMQVQT